MKKIKLLLLGIVSILGIGLSSAEITFISYPFSGGPTYNLVPGYNSLPAVDNLAGSDDLHIFSPVDGLSLIGYSGTNLFSFNVPYIFADDFTIFNSTTSNISLTPTRVNLTGRPGFGSSIFPYYQSGYVGIYDYEISGQVSVGGYGTGEFYMGENSCIYNYTNGNLYYCDLEDHNHCYKANNYQTLICGDGFYYYSSINYNRYFDYIGIHFIDTSGGGDPDTPQDFESPVQGGIWDYNTMLIEKAILCYMSDGSFGGEYGDCDGINYSGFINQYTPSYTTWSGSSIEDYYGQLLFTNAQPVLSNYCVNTDLIQYPFCSQLDLYSGAYLLYFFENGKLDYYVLGDGFGVDLGNLGSGQLGELTCQGAWCNNISQGLPNYIFPANSGNNNDFGLSGDIISEDFYKDFINKGFWFRCPYSYSGSYFVIGKDLINRLGGRDLMIPINCFISAFSMGSKMLLFGDPQYGKYLSGSLINGNTPGHQRLFLFFDLILSIGIVFVLFNLYNLFTSKK